MKIFRESYFSIVIFIFHLATFEDFYYKYWLLVIIYWSIWNHRLDWIIRLLEEEEWKSSIEWLRWPSVADAASSLPVSTWLLSYCLNLDYMQGCSVPRLHNESSFLWFHHLPCSCGEPCEFWSITYNKSMQQAFLEDFAFLIKETNTFGAFFFPICDLFRIPLWCTEFWQSICALEAELNTTAEMPALKWNQLVPTHLQTIRYGKNSNFKRWRECYGFCHLRLTTLPVYLKV